MGMIARMVSQRIVFSYQRTSVRRPISDESTARNGSDAECRSVLASDVKRTSKVEHGSQITWRLKITNCRTRHNRLTMSRYCTKPDQHIPAKVCCSEPLARCRNVQLDRKISLKRVTPVRAARFSVTSRDRNHSNAVQFLNVIPMI
jgi:hypothetical protein